MDTGYLNDVAGKLGLARASRPMLIGMAVILVLAAAAVAHVLSGAAAANDFEIGSLGASADVDEAPYDEAVAYVHVSGEVNEPGLYQVETGSRVADAVNAAGGFTEDADESACNLARIIDDGEHIVIPSIDETSSPPNTDGEIEQGARTSSAAIVNINTATVDQFEALPGIGAVTARRIIADRDENGPFGSVEDLTRVSGIGQKKLEALEGLICV